MARVDLHLHSRASTDTASWFLRRAILPESYTPPQTAYATAKARGMDFVTLSDHNTIVGALEIAHHADAFVSVEATVLFPEDGVPLHVLVWGLDESQWNEIDRLRANVYELVDYLDAERLVHALAHPLQRLGAELTVDHIEKCLLLFRRWEGRNGARVKEGNDAACKIAAAASSEFLAKLAEKHGVAPRGDGPPALVGGSDDHGLLDVAATWTETPQAATTTELLEHLRDGDCEPRGAHGSTLTLAHSLTSLVAREYAERGAPGIPPPLRSLFSDLIGHPLNNTANPAQVNGGDDVMRRLRSDHEMIRAFRAASRLPDGAARSHQRLHLAMSWAGHTLAARGRGRGKGADLDGPAALLDRLAGLGGSAMLSLPYLAATAYHAGEARFAARIDEAFFGASIDGARRHRVAMLTDTFDQINGAAGTLRRFAQHSTRTGAPSVVMTCQSSRPSVDAVVNIRPLFRFGIPGYPDADWKLGVPSMIELIKAIERQRIDVIHAATPGPMGVAGLLIARAMGLDFVASHHTELAKYALELTGDRLAAELMRGAVGWFYRQARIVFSPSTSADDTLIELGVPADRIVRFTRGIDVEAFTPARRSWLSRRRVGGDTQILYVGRISKEKGLTTLANAFRVLSATRPGVRLILVGDGPARAEIASSLRGLPHHFTGVLSGQALATAYASADIFCLPSTTETFGQVVLEAAASGLPGVVMSTGGAGELVIDGVTGLIVKEGETASLADALGALVDDPQRRDRMGAAARLAALEWPTWDDTFGALYDGYAGLAGPGRDTSWPATAWDPVP